VNEELVLEVLEVKIKIGQPYKIFVDYFGKLRDLN
jgi:hypothetical protein